METLASQLDIVGEEAWWKAYNEANRVFEEIRARRTERRKKLQQAAVGRQERSKDQMADFAVSDLIREKRAHAVDDHQLYCTRTRLCRPSGLVACGGCGHKRREGTTIDQATPAHRPQCRLCRDRCDPEEIVWQSGKRTVLQHHGQGCTKW